MKVITASPPLFLAALLAIFGIGRFAFSFAYVIAGKEDQLRQQHARQSHLMGSVKALLREGKAADAAALLTQAEKTGTIAFYSVRREEETIAAGGNEKGALMENAELRAEVGNFTVRLVSQWSWPKKAGATARGVGEELASLLIAAVLLWAAGARLKSKRSPRKAKVRILRDVSKNTSLRPTEGLAMEGEAFECTILRVQIGSPENGESALLALAPLLESARTEIVELLARYGGELASAHGHEIICYFRDQGDGHTALLSLSATRDFRAILQPKTGKICIHYALAHGFARFVKAGGQEAQLLGAPFLEVNRLTAEPGQILVTERLAKFAAPTVKFKVRDNLIAYANHTELEEVLGRCERGLFGELDGYHGDQQLMEILQSLDHDTSAEQFIGIVNQLRRFFYKRAGPETAQAFKVLFRRELENGNSFRISSLVALASHFFTKETIDQELYADFLAALNSTDRRVKSNTIELFIHLYPNQEIAELRPYAKSADHRISANLLIKRALEHFDEKVVRALYGRVRGGSVAHVASALFALGEIAQYYKAQDPVSLRGKQSFLRLFEEIPYWVQHPNGMVRRQAALAAKKLADPVLEARIRKIFAETSDTELLALLESVYGWSKAKKSAA